MQLNYPEFIARASAALVSSGSRHIQVPPQAAATVSEVFPQEWEPLYLTDGPGASTLFAFTDAGSVNIDVLRFRLDRLAEAISSLGLLRGTPLRLVAVMVFPHGPSTVTSRHVSRLAPSTYFPGLRPSTWCADLASRKLVTGHLIRPEGADVLSTALSETLDTPLLGAHDIQALQAETARRTAAFYRLMQGRQPFATYGLIALNVAAFLLLYTSGSPDNENTLKDFGALSGTLVQQGQWWRIFTSMFLHASVTHILFNMTSLFAVGTLAERLYGSKRFLSIYLGAGLIGSIASIGYAFATGHPDILGVGASGAIFGVAGALLTVRFQASEIIPQRLRDRISTSLLPLVAISLLISFFTPFVDNAAHVGGLLGGMALSFVFPLVRNVAMHE
ncbi:MAG: hypothetical protein NVSMB52_02870 [Chloroflexota bacterium]